MVYILHDPKNRAPEKKTLHFLCFKFVLILFRSRGMRRNIIRGGDIYGGLHIYSIAYVVFYRVIYFIDMCSNI